MKIFKISIAMCTYNGEKFLQEQLQSISSQTRLPDELIICDDNSDDNTRDILNNFAREKPFKVHLFFNEKQLGSSSNFEKAIKLCSGDIIFLADQDDIWIPEKIKVIENVFFGNNDIGAVFSNAAIIDEESTPLTQTLWQSVQLTTRNQAQMMGDHAIHLLLKRNFITGATMAFRKNYQQSIFPIPTEWTHDQWIALFVGLQSSIYPVNQNLVKYRIHSSQQLGIQRTKPLETLKLKGKASEMIQQDINRYSKALEHLITLYPESTVKKYKTYFEDKISHLKFRKNLSSNKVKGFLIVMFKLFSGEYHRYSSRSSLSALFDIYRLISPR